MQCGARAEGCQRLDTILIFSGEEGVVSWVVSRLVFEEGEGGFDEFVEDGEEDGPLGFAGSGEAGVEAAGDHGGHEEDAAQVAVALNADGGGVAQAAAALADARGDGELGGGGAAVGQVARDFGAEPAGLARPPSPACPLRLLGGAFAEAFDLAEALEVGVEFGRGLEVGGDLGLDALDFLFQRAGHAGEAFGDENSGGGGGAVALGAEQGLEVGEAAQELAQALQGGVGGLPVGPGAGGAKAGRVRFHYCGASDAQDRTPELRKIGLQPRRLPGEAQAGDLPLAPGAVTHDAAARTLAVAALPEHATSVRAFRQVLGGPVVLAGTSPTGTVSYVAASPLTPGASYTVWLTGHNSEGDGPQSQVFTFTA